MPPPSTRSRVLGLAGMLLATAGAAVVLAAGPVPRRAAPAPRRETLRLRVRAAPPVAPAPVATPPEEPVLAGMLPAVLAVHRERVRAYPNPGEASRPRRRHHDTQ